MGVGGPVSPARSKKKVVLLNVYATLFAAVEENPSAKAIVLENLMHEFGHVLQEWLDLEFDEGQVETFIRSQAEKYHGEGYEEVHGDQSLAEK